MADACDCISAQFWSEVSCIDLQGPLFHCNDINPCCSWGSQSRPIFHLVKHMCRGINAFPFLFLVTKRQLPDNTCELLHRSVSVTHFAFQQQGDYVSFYCNISLKQFLFYWCIVVFSLSPPPPCYLSNFYMKLSLKLVSTFTACLSCVLITIFCVCSNVHCATIWHDTEINC